MELKELRRVVDTIESRLDLAIAEKYPLAIKMVPKEIKSLIKDALEGAYASGFNHGMIEGTNGKSTK